MNGSSHITRFQSRHALSLAVTVVLGFLSCHSAIRAATFTVTTTSDNGAGSLRQAQFSTPTPPTISTRSSSAFPGAGVHTILPSSQLPTVTNSVIIDGYTQTNSSPNTLTNGNNAVLLIELEGSNAGQANGLVISASNCVVRGLVIDKFLTPCCIGYGFGIILSGKGGHVIEGNFIGVNPGGTVATGNGDTGVSISGSSGNRIGDATPAARNVISGNDAFGVDICCGSLAASNQILGNYIGTDRHGTAALPNSGGVRLAYSSNNIVGGPSVLARNIISGNYGGLTLAQNEAVGNVVQGNFIGVAVDGVSPLGNNGYGVGFFNAANGNLIGGTNNGEGNTIAFNTSAGVQMGGGVPGNGFDVRNSILGNSIFSNNSLGIDLLETNGVAGVTTNDGCDVDLGPNGLQNFPVLTSASNTVGGTAIQGSLDSASNANFRIEFFSNPACDSSGSGEGKTYLGFTNVTTDANCTASFDVTLAVDVPAGEFITATATSTNGNTSEFSQCVPVVGTVPSIDCSLLPAAAMDYIGASHSVTVTVTSNAVAIAGVIVDFTVSGGPNAGQSFSTNTDVNGEAVFQYDSNSTPGTDTISATGTVNSAAFSCSATATWVMADDLTVEVNPSSPVCGPDDKNKNQVCTVDGTLSFLKRAGESYADADFTLTKTCKLGPKIGCKMSLCLDFDFMDLSGLPDHFVQFYLSDDAVLDAGDVPLLKKPVAMSKVQKAFSKEKTFCIKKLGVPSGTDPAGKFLLVKADDLNPKTGEDAVEESIESNNDASFGTLP